LVVLDAAPQRVQTRADHSLRTCGEKRPHAGVGRLKAPVSPANGSLSHSPIVWNLLLNPSRRPRETVGQFTLLAVNEIVEGFR